MPDTDEMIALLRLYGNVIIIDGDHIIFKRNKRSQFRGCPNVILYDIGKWMENTVKAIEYENKRARYL